MISEGCRFDKITLLTLRIRKDHYKNIPIQIYCKFNHQKMKKKNIYIDTKL